MNINFKQIAESKVFRIVVFCIAGIIVALLIFQAGLFFCANQKGLSALSVCSRTFHSCLAITVCQLKLRGYRGAVKSDNFDESYGSTGHTNSRDFYNESYGTLLQTFYLLF